MAHLVMVGAASHTPMMMSARNDASTAERTAVLDSMRILGDDLVSNAVDAVVVVSNEHFTNFFLDNIPAFCIGLGARHFGPTEGWLGIVQTWIPGESSLAASIAEGLMERDFEPAFSHELRLDHGVIDVYHEITLGRRHLPLIPILQNCSVRPMPTLRRCHAFGIALAEAIEAAPVPHRVAVIGSGGLSHSVGTVLVGQIDQEFDHWFVDHLADGRIDELTALSDDDLEVAGNGTHEVRSWLTAAGAARGVGAELLTYQPVRSWLTGMGVARWPVGPGERR